MTTPEQHTDDLPSRIRAFVDELIVDTSLFVVEINVRGQKGSRVVEVFLDSEDSLLVDKLAEISRELGFLLETEDLIKGKYNLVVSSPGVKRPLKDIRQYRKNIGRPLKVTVAEEGNHKVVKGTLVRVDGDDIVLKEKNNESIIPFAVIEKAIVQLPW